MKNEDIKTLADLAALCFKTNRYEEDVIDRILNEGADYGFSEEEIISYLNQDFEGWNYGQAR
jgi:hypothetical protein